MELKGKFQYKKIETNQDILQAYEIYRTNVKYFRLILEREPELQDIGNDRSVLPEAVPTEQKHYGLYFIEGKPVAVVDMIEAFPEPDVLYIGFFMINGKCHRKGFGSALYRQIEEKALQAGYDRIRLGVVDINEKGNAFWTALGFQKIKAVEVKSPYGTDWVIHVMEKKLTR